MVKAWEDKGKIEGWKKRGKEKKRGILHIVNVGFSLCLYVSSNVVE